jgi:predicted nucleotidyltransferase
VHSPTDTDARLQQVVDALVATVDPEKIILFGSRARSDDAGTSDIDLFLQVETGRDTRQLAAESYKTIHRLKERPLVGIDVVVKDNAFVERFGNSVGTIVRPALAEGKLLYARRKHV